MTAWATNPQAAQIDALIERAARLTSVECERLIEARRPVWNKARIAARDAAWFAAAVAARAAVGFAARDAVAARAAARAAARDAVAASVAGPGSGPVAGTTAVALVVRDLIDEATEWNQAAYDVLTRPWRWAIGPIHPDDEVPR